MDKLNLIFGLVVLLLGTIQFGLQADVVRVGWMWPKTAGMTQTSALQCRYLKCEDSYKMSDLKADGSSTREFKSAMTWDAPAKKAVYNDWIKYTKITRFNSEFQPLILTAGVFVAFLGILIVLKAVKNDVDYLNAFAWVTLTLAVISGSLSMFDIDQSRYGPSKAEADRWNKKWPALATTDAPFNLGAYVFTTFFDICYLNYENIPAATIDTLFTDGTLIAPAYVSLNVPLNKAGVYALLDNAGDLSLWDKATCAPSSLYQAINSFSIINAFVVLLLVVWWSCPCKKKILKSAAVNPQPDGGGPQSEGAAK